jgi:hypothetical protein
MSNKPLTDELRSVLLAHSFDAPEPASTIESILAQTTEADADQSRGRASSVLASVRRLRPLAAALATVAAVAVIAAGIVGLGSLGDDSSKSASTASSAGSAQEPAGSPNASDRVSQGDAERRPSHSVKAPVAGSASATTGAVPGSTGFPLPAASCAQGQSGSVTLAAALPVQTSASGEALAFVQRDCRSQKGVSVGSDLSVYRNKSGKAELIATLIRPAQQILLGSVTVDAGSRTVVVEGRHQNSTFRYTFSISADQHSFTVKSTQPVG